jgi:arylsulfatase A-like enzyme
LLVVPGGGNELQSDAYTLGSLFKTRGYSTIYYGKWHLGVSAQSDPQYCGFDEWRLGFYGSSDGTLSGDNMVRFHAPAALPESGTIVVRESRSQHDLRVHVRQRPHGHRNGPRGDACRLGGTVAR